VPGAANLVTGSRLVLALPAFWFAWHPSAFGIGLGVLVGLVVVAGVSDLVDGWVARRFDRPTKFGAAFDPIADGFFFGAVGAGFALGGAYPAWLAVVVVLRYLLPALVGGAMVLAGMLPALRHTFFGQLSTAVIAVLLGGVALLRSLGLTTGVLLAVAELVIPLLTLLAWFELAWTARRLAATRGAPGSAGAPDGS